jgi:hypothetical protein
LPWYLNQIVYRKDLNKPILTDRLNFDSITFCRAAFLKIEISNVTSGMDTVALKYTSEFASEFLEPFERLIIFDPSFHDSILIENYYYAKIQSINLSIERNFWPSNPDTLFDSANIIFNQTVELLPKDTVTIQIDI